MKAVAPWWVVDIGEVSSSEKSSARVVRMMNPRCKYIQRVGAHLCVVQVVKAEANLGSRLGTMERDHSLYATCILTTIGIVTT